MSQVSKEKYDVASRVFHWLTAVVVLVAFILGPGDFGRFVHNGGDPGTRVDILWHESLGLTVFALTLLRLLWVAVRPDAPAIAMTDTVRRLSRAAHGLLWLLLLAVPVTALMALGSEGYPLTALGGLRIEQLPLPGQAALAGMADWGEVHKFLGDAIVWIAGLHAAAAIYHHVFLKDKVLTSILP